MIPSGVVFEKIGQRRDLHLDPQIGRSVDIGGRTLNIYCSGEGSRTVIFDTFGHASGYSWIGFNRTSRSLPEPVGTIVPATDGASLGLGGEACDRERAWSRSAPREPSAQPQLAKRSSRSRIVNMEEITPDAIVAAVREVTGAYENPAAH